MVISLPKIPYIHRIYMVLAKPTNKQTYVMLLHQATWLVQTVVVVKRLSCLFI